MGSSMNKISSYFSGKEECRVLMQGLDAAGKTTVLYVMKLGEVVTTIPTIGFNVETVEFKNVKITAWDVGGRDKIRPLWRHYYQNTRAIIFVIDSNDRERTDQVSNELQVLLNEDELRDLPILFLANKQDLENAMPVNEISEKLNLNQVMGKRKWHVQPTVATKKHGVQEGFQWLSDVLTKKDDSVLKPFIESGNDSKIMKNDMINMLNSIGMKSIFSKFFHY